MSLQRVFHLLPSNALRVWVWQWHGLNCVPPVSIGWKTVISSPRTCVLGTGSAIGGNCVICCSGFQVGNRTRVLSDNQFIGAGTFTIGQDARIIAEHYFDLYGNITIGDRTWIAGRGSQFWTHGTFKSCSDTSIRIGNDCYIASRVLFAPGAGVGDGCLVALGAVVTKRFDETRCLIAGCPARVVRRDLDWRAEWK